jgi:hypothetical protein
VLAHAELADPNGALLGQREALGGWDYGKRGVQRIAGALWVPGSVTAGQRSWWTVSGSGVWHIDSAQASVPEQPA